MISNVYLNRVASFLPNSPVNNDEMESYLGLVNGKASRVKFGRSVIRKMAKLMGHKATTVCMVIANRLAGEANSSYKKTTNTTIKATGLFNLGDMTIVSEDKELGEVERSVTSLLSDFDGETISFSVTLKTEEELGDPSEE